MQKYIIIWRKNEYISAGNEINYDEVSLEKMKETWQFIKEYTFWFLAHPKAKHDFTTEQFVLWEKNKEKSDGKAKELYELIEKFSKDDYICRRNSISLQTIPWIIHYHIAKFKNMDKKISTIL